MKGGRAVESNVETKKRRLNVAHLLLPDTIPAEVRYDVARTTGQKFRRRSFVRRNRAFKHPLLWAVIEPLLMALRETRVQDRMWRGRPYRVLPTKKPWTGAQLRAYFNEPLWRLGWCVLVTTVDIRAWLAERGIHQTKRDKNYWYVRVQAPVGSHIPAKEKT
jgi:hypothetical protein